MKKAFGGLTMAILVVATWLTFSHHPLTKPINTWQADIMGDNSYLPALTIFALAIPPLLLLLVIKRIIKPK
jgi:hypothetical protein